MTPVYVGVGLFMVAMIVFALVLKNESLETLPMGEGESLLLDDGGVWVEMDVNGPERARSYPGCRVHLTDRRIIVAQKMLMQKKHQVHALIDYRGEPDAGAYGSTRTYGVFSTDPASVNWADAKGQPVVVLTVKALPGAFQAVFQVTIHTQQLEEYRRILGAE